MTQTDPLEICIYANRLFICVYAQKKKDFICVQDFAVKCVQVPLPLANVRYFVAPCSPRGRGRRILRKMIHLNVAAQVRSRHPQGYAQNSLEPLTCILSRF